MGGLHGAPGGDYRNPSHLGTRTSIVYAYTKDVDAHCARARAAGAKIVEEPADQPYGDRRYGAEDPEGQHWYFAAPIRKAEAMRQSSRPGAP